MRILEGAFLPLWIGIAAMIVAAIINARTQRVPNGLSIGGILAGLLSAATVDAFHTRFAGAGSFTASLAAALTGFALLLPAYFIGGLGAGCLKMQMAFGAWIGCALPVSPAALP